MTSKSTVNIVVVFVGIAMLACIGGIIGLSATQTSIPTVLETTTGTLVGGFIALLVSTRSGPAAEVAAALPVIDGPGEAAPK